MDAFLGDTLTETIKQLPFVAILIWFVVFWSDRIQKSFDMRQNQLLTFLREQRKLDRKTMENICHGIACLENTMNEHRQETSVRVEKMNHAIDDIREKTKPRDQVLREREERDEHPQGR